MFRKAKEKINMLMNIDNYFGEHRGRIGPTVTFLLVCAAPFLLYVITVARWLPLKYMLIFEVFFAARMALYILLDEPGKLIEYKKTCGYELSEEEEEKSEKTLYESANDLVRISRVTENGMIEYLNGNICYIVSGFFMTYMDDVEMTEDFNNFISQFHGYEYDILCQQAVDEFRLSDNVGKLKVYKDREVMYERMKFYELQDKVSKESMNLYRVSIVVKGSKYDWKNLYNRLLEIVDSEFSEVFFCVKILNGEGVNDILSRDICANIDLRAMLVQKYKNEEFFGSEVLFYGDEIPDEYLPKREDAGLENRRVQYDKEGNV